MLMHEELGYCSKLQLSKNTTGDSNMKYVFIFASGKVFVGHFTLFATP